MHILQKWFSTLYVWGIIFNSETLVKADTWAQPGKRIKTLVVPFFFYNSEGFLSATSVPGARTRKI